MKTSNAPSGALRTSEVSLCWEEICSNASGSFEVNPSHCVRVRAVALSTVTIDGRLAATLAADEIMLFNTGDGNPNDTKPTVTVTVSAACYIQVGREVERVRQVQNIP
jgi:hypothetical protein